MRVEQDNRGRAGVTVVEFLVAATITLVITIGVYGIIDWARRSFVKQTDQAESQSNGRVALDWMSAEIRAAGYSPLGARFNGLPAGTATSVRVMADLDGDGVVGTSTETDENITYVFTGPNAAGLYELVRGVDLAGDGDFTDTGDSSATVESRIVAVDYNGDGTNEPFLAHDATPPATTRVTITFGVRAASLDLDKGTYPVSRFRTDVTLRNTLLR